MKVLLYSYLFFPSVGGIESISATLADGLINEGHFCRIITESVYDKPDNFKYPIYRKPGSSIKRSLINWADIIVFNGASLGLQPWVLFYGKPFVWIHQGYQVICVDGLGWVEGNSAPLSPVQSIVFHYKRKGLFYAAKGAVKVFVKLFFAKYLVTKNVACSDWVLNRLPALHQKITIHSPYPLKKFEHSAETTGKFDFVFVGRMVSEKGLPTLVRAFNELVKNKNESLSLLIIGDGDRRPLIEQMIVDSGLEKNITLAGRKTGQELTDLIHSCKIAIVPSEWEEPLGGVALELLSAGRNIIVSKNGGMTECIGQAGLTFTNGNSDELAYAMYKLWADKDLQTGMKEKAIIQLKAFQPEYLVFEHIKLFEQLIKK